MKEIKKSIRSFKWEGGIHTPLQNNNPKGANQYKDKPKKPKPLVVVKPKVVEVMPKPLTEIEKYHKACEIREQIEKHKIKWTKLRKEYRSLSQKMGEMYKEMESYLVK